MDFSEGLFGCFNDCGSCCIVAFLPCGFAFIQGSAVGLAANQNCILPFINVACNPCMGGACNRMKIRKGLSIDGNLGEDCLLHWFVGPCAICQESREVKRRLNQNTNAQTGNADNRDNLIENQ